MLLLLSVNSLGFNTEPTPVTNPNVPQLTSFAWDVIDSPQYAGESVSVVIRARDENGNSYPLNGTAGLATTLDDANSYVYPAYVEFKDGVCGTRVVVTIADSLALKCQKGAAAGISNVFQVLPGAMNRLMAILPGEQLAPGVPGGISGRPEDQAAGDTFSVSVYLTDEWYNKIESGDDSIFFGSDDQYARLPEGGQLSDGTGSFPASLRAAGLHRVYALPASGESLLADTSSTVTVTPGPFTQMLLVAPGETLQPGDTTLLRWDTPGKTGAPTPQYLRRPFAVAVYPCDRCWNLVSGPNDTVFLRSDFPVAFQPPAALLRDSAVFGEVQFNTAGPNQNIRAVDQVTGNESYDTRLNIRALGITLDITAPDTVRSGDTTPVLVRVLDANGDPIVAALVQSSVVKGSGTMLDPALLTDTLGYTAARFVCMPSPASERDSIRINSGEADTVIGIYVRHLSDSLFAFPNPFGSVNSNRTLIFYSLHRASSVRVTIYDPFGNEVWAKRFSQGEPGAMLGDNTIYWDGTNKKGQRVASGIYLVQILGTLSTGIDYKSLYRVGVVW